MRDLASCIMLFICDTYNNSFLLFNGFLWQMFKVAMISTFCIITTFCLAQIKMAWYNCARQLVLDTSTSSLKFIWTFPDSRIIYIQPRQSTMWLCIYFHPVKRLDWFLIFKLGIGFSCLNLLAHVHIQEHGRAKIQSVTLLTLSLRLKCNKNQSI